MPWDIRMGAGVFFRYSSKNCNFDTSIKDPLKMTQIVIDKKKYVLVPEKEYTALQIKAALKTKPEKLLSLEEGRAHSLKLIRKWASGK